MPSTSFVAFGFPHTHPLLCSHCASPATARPPIHNNTKRNFNHTLSIIKPHFSIQPSFQLIIKPRPQPHSPLNGFLLKLAVAGFFSAVFTIYNYYHAHIHHSLFLPSFSPSFPSQSALHYSAPLLLQQHPHPTFIYHNSLLFSFFFFFLVFCFWVLIILCQTA